jgi:starch phosphorylase
MPAFQGRIVLAEGYDIAIARYLVSGVDVWLNTPRRPFEASGTSGMKVAMNGGTNFSVLDGWWCEAARHGVNGWSIGDEREVDDEERLAQQDALTLYHLVEEAIAPRYYERNSQGVPEAWMKVAKASMKTIPPVFNTDRMVSEYGRRFYFPAIAKGRRLADGGHALARELARWKASIRSHWQEVSVRWGTDQGEPRLVIFGEKVELSAQVRLGKIAPTDVLVEAYIREILPTPGEEDAHRIPLKPTGGGDGGFLEYQGTFVPPDSGRFTVTVRVTPHHPEFIQPHELGLICWLGSDPEGGAPDRPPGTDDAEAAVGPAHRESGGGGPKTA